MRLLVLFMTLLFVTGSDLYALALGGSVGAGVPFAHRNEYETGLAAEGFFRQDPYEIRFQYSGTKVDMYTISVAIKHFFTTDVARPYIEGAVGPVIVNSSRGQAYGIKPEVSLGLDIGINRHFSAAAVTRYFGAAYFGSTNSGKFEANHGLTLLGQLLVWF